MVGGVDGLGEIAPTGQCRNTVLAEELHRGQHVRAGRQQSAVAERAEDAGVVGGGGAQVEQVPFGGRHGVVEKRTQLVGEAVEFLGGEGSFGTWGAVGARSRRFSGAPARGAVRLPAGSRLGRAACGPHRVVGAGPWTGHPGVRGRGRAGQAQQFREPLLGGQGLGEAPLGLVGALGRRRGVGGAGRGQLRTGLGGGRLARVLGDLAGGLAGRVPGGDGGLLGVAGGERGTGRVGVRCAVVEPAGADGLGGLLLDLGETLAQMSGLTAGALCLGRGGGGVAVGAVADLLERGGALLLLVGEGLGAAGGRVQGPYEVHGGLGTRGEGGRGVPLGLLDGGGHARDTVGGGAVAQHGLGGLPGGVQGARVGQLALLRGGGLLGGGQRQGGVPVGEFGGDQGAALPRALGVRDGVRGGRDPLGEVGGPHPLPHGPGGQPPGERAGTALGAAVHVTRA